MQSKQFSVFFFVSVLLLTSCNKSNFRSSSKKDQAKANPTENPPIEADAKPVGEISFPAERKGNDVIWVAATNSSLTYLRVEVDNVAEIKKWSGLLSETGYRTYATETGVFLGGTGGHLFWIDSNQTKEGPIDTGPSSVNYLKIPGTSSKHRVCPVVYRRDRKRFMGAAYTPGFFLEVPLEDTPPFKPIWSQANAKAARVKRAYWGYSCFIDQERLIYYAASDGERVAAIDLKTMQEVTPADVVPNGSFTSSNIPHWTAGADKAFSYAISGDRKGNILNGKSVYNMAHEPLSDTIWISGYGAAEPGLAVVPRKCIDSAATCQGFIGLNTASLNARVSPMSALRGGFMVGLQRAAAASRVYLMKLQDPTNVGAGIVVKNIHEVGGDPYMYSDFTGSTLFVLELESSISLSKASDFNLEKTTSHLEFSWESSQPKDSWKDLELYVTCYTKGSAKPAYVKIEKVADSGTSTQIEIPECSQKKYDMVDIKISQINNADNLKRITSMKITPFQ